MSGNIANSHPNFLLISIFNGYKIIIIPTGIITVDTFACYVESINFQITFGKKILLNLLGQIKRLLQSSSSIRPLVISLIASPVYPISSLEKTSTRLSKRPFLSQKVSE